MKSKFRKVFLIVVAVLFVLVFVILAGVWSMFGDKLMAANSVEKLDEGLYYMEYKGDYGFETFLEQGGAASEAAMAEYIISFLSNGFAKNTSNPVPQNFGCSTLNKGNLMGRNFDWPGTEESAMIVHTKPENGYASYSTCWLEFLGFGEAWKPEGMANQYMSLAAIYVPLDGMNEKGLCVADLVNGDEEQTHQQTEKADLTTSSAIRLLLDKAATVDEAIALLEQYDMNSAIGMSHHLAISDADGRSVVVEYINNEMIVTETPAVTNHYLSPGEKYDIGQQNSHDRYDLLMYNLPRIVTIDDLKGAMQDVVQLEATQWTIIYNKYIKSFDFYWRQNYKNVYTFGF